MKAKKSYQLYRDLFENDVYICELRSHKEAMKIAKASSKDTGMAHKVMRVESECVAEYEGGRVVRKGQKRKGGAA